VFLLPIIEYLIKKPPVPTKQAMINYWYWYW